MSKRDDILETHLAQERQTLKAEAPYLNRDEIEARKTEIEKHQAVIDLIQEARKQ